MFELADYYGEENLKTHCEEQLRVLISVDDYTKVYATTVQFNSKVTMAPPDQ